MVNGVHHVTINVKDMEKSIRFYGEFLQLKRLPDIRMPDHTLTYFVLSGETKLELIQYDENTEKAEYDLLEKGIYRHLALETKHLEDLSTAVAEYGGTVLQPPKWVEALNFTGMLILDPNGCELELIEQRTGQHGEGSNRS